jgi:DNA-binding response OmpR family regulator
MNILIASGDKKLVDRINRELEKVQYKVHYVAESEMWQKSALEKQFDLIVLDWLLFKKGGLNVLKELREHQSFAQILMLTPKDSVEEVIVSLDSGASACLSKPFEIRVLIARMKALTRRRRWNRGVEIRYAHIRIDLITHEVWSGSTEIGLTDKEYAILVCFMRNTGQILTREIIAENVWGHPLNRFDNSVNVFVNRLRKKIDDGADKKLIHTIKGVGNSFIGYTMSE